MTNPLSAYVSFEARVFQWRKLADSSEPLTALAALVAVIVAQSALVAGLAGLAVRKLTQ